MSEKCFEMHITACRNVVVVVGVRYAERGRKTWRECVKEDMVELGLYPDLADFRDIWRGLISGKRLILAKHGRNGRFKNK